MVIKYPFSSLTWSQFWHPWLGCVKLNLSPLLLFSHLGSLSRPWILPPIHIFASSFQGATEARAPGRIGLLNPDNLGKKNILFVLNSASQILIAVLLSFCQMSFLLRGAEIIWCRYLRPLSDGLAWCLQFLLLNSDEPSSCYQCQHPNTSPTAASRPFTLTLSSLSGYQLPGPQKVAAVFLTRLEVIWGTPSSMIQIYWSLHLNRSARTTQATSGHVLHLPETPDAPWLQPR